MRIRIALALLLLVSLGQASALPTQIDKEIPQTAVIETKVTSTESKPQESVTVESQPTAPPVVSEKEIVPPTNAEQGAKAFIYFKESGNNPLAKNSQGCFGLGQDCNGIVEIRCGGDYSCQDAYFTQYMQRRYGTWQAAKSFWLARVPINGRDVGNWW